MKKTRMLTWYWSIMFWITYLPLSLILLFLLFNRVIINIVINLPLNYIIKNFYKTSHTNSTINLLCIAYMNDENASARHRLYKFSEIVKNGDIVFKIEPPTSKEIYRKYFLPWKRSSHYYYFICLFLNRFITIWKSPMFDAVLLQREIISEFFYDPPCFIFLLWLLNQNIIYDIDDASWMLPPHSIRARSKILNKLAELRFEWNVRLSKIVVVSNEYLAQKVKTINKSVFVIPTLVDAINAPKKNHSNNSPIVIGWTGSPGNLCYLDLIKEILVKLSKKHSIIFRIISSKSIEIDRVNVDFIAWDKLSELNWIATFDIGIMPLPDNEYTRGKAGFKILEYMAASVPVVASPVGINKEIITDGENGFLAFDEREWEKKLRKLIQNVSIRRSTGLKGLNYATKNYDYSEWITFYTDIIRKAVIS